MLDITTKIARAIQTNPEVLERLRCMEQRHGRHLQVALDDLELAGGRDELVWSERAHLGGKALLGGVPELERAVEIHARDLLRQASSLRGEAK